MSRSGRDPGTRLKTAKKRTVSSARWLQRQLNDPYVRQAKADGYRSRPGQCPDPPPGARP